MLSTDRDCPVIIGCTGGSGGQALQDIIAHARFFMGKYLYPSLDSLHFAVFAAGAVKPVLEHTHSTNYTMADLPDELKQTLMASLEEAIDSFRKELPETALGWGWKLPQNMLLLPVYHALCPHMRFVHLIRDGRDMALSSNQDQLIFYYKECFGIELRNINPVNSIELWEKLNLGVHAWAKATLKHRYYWLRYEDLCRNPRLAIRDLSYFLGYNWDTHLFTNLVKPSPSIGRYRQLSENTQLEIEAAGMAGLRQFGYV